MPKKIVVIGPESTGKSTLSSQLSEYFHCPWVPEYAREYLLKNGMHYNYHDLLAIAKGQIGLEDKTMAQAKNGLIFIDTNMYVMKVWCEFVFGKVHPWILEQISKREYDLYLLCNTDLPWVKDELREYPQHDTRKRLFDIYRELMAHQKVPFIEISGNYEQRLGAAVKAVESLLSH